MDDFERKILRVLQKEGAISQRELSDRVGLSQNACWRRMQIMRDKGIIIGERVQLSREALGLGLTVFLLIRTRQHSESWLEKFRRIMLDIPNVIDFHRLAGDYDYQVKLAVPDIKEFDRIYRGLIARIDLGTVTSCISMEDYCDEREYPI